MATPWGLVFKVVTQPLSWIYNKAYKRPKLALDANTDYLIDNGQRWTTWMQLCIVNDGRDMAENATIEFGLCEWDFEPNECVKNPESDLDMNVNRTEYFVGDPRVVYKLSISEPVHKGARHRLFFGRGMFEKEGCYKIEYTVASNSHGPRVGAMYLCVHDGEVAVKREDPSLLKHMKEELFGHSVPENSTVGSIPR